jgi:hypothetical protein
LLAHDLFGKPGSTFPDHALMRIAQASASGPYLAARGFGVAFGRAIIKKRRPLGPGNDVGQREAIGVALALRRAAEGGKRTRGLRRSGMSRAEWTESQQAGNQQRSRISHRFTPSFAVS